MEITRMRISTRLHSRHKFTALLTLIITILIGVTIAAAQDTLLTTITPAEGVAAVNVRSGPGTDYTVRFALNDGQTLVTTGRTEATTCTGNAETDGWVRITVSETIEGWVSICAVEVSGDVSALPVAEPAFPELIAEAEPLAVLEGGSNFTNPDMVAETNADVIMRSEPWLGSEALGIVPANTAVELMQMTTNMGWVQASYGETTGWLLGMTVDASETQQSTLPAVPISQVAQGVSTSNGGLTGFCLWFPGLRQVWDIYGNSTLVVEYNQWSLCY
jgi:uncharacterized protein YraI